MSGKHPDPLDGIGPFAVDHELQVVGALPDNLVEELGIVTIARTVFIGPTGIVHIIGQRGRDALFVLKHVGAVVRHPIFWGVDPGDANRVLLVERVEKERHLCIVLKFLPAAKAATLEDEIWVTTGYPVGEESLRRMLRGGRLRPLVWRAGN